MTATGIIWSRYSTVITPINYNLLSVNVFMAGTGMIQLYRKLTYVAIGSLDIEFLLGIKEPLQLSRNEIYTTRFFHSWFRCLGNCLKLCLLMNRIGWLIFDSQ